MPIIESSKRERGTYIGGRHAAAISGIGYSSPVDVYAELVLGAKTELNGAMLRGTLMEPGLLSYVEEQRGVKLQRDVFVKDDHIAHFGGSIDGVESTAVIHETKTTTTRSAHKWGAPGTSEVEETCYAQVQWYMSIKKATETHTWLSIVDGDDFPLHYIVPFDSAYAEVLRDNADEFWWNHVESKVPPSGKGNGSAMDALYPSHQAGLVAKPTPELIAASIAYANVNAEIKKLKETKELERDIIKSILGEAESAKWDTGSITWRNMKLTPKTNWEQVAHELAMHHGINGEVFNGYVRKNTSTPSTSTRVLRVTTKG